MVLEVALLVLFQPPSAEDLRRRLLLAARPLNLDGPDQEAMKTDMRVRRAAVLPVCKQGTSIHRCMQTGKAVTGKQFGQRSAADPEPGCKPKTIVEHGNGTYDRYMLQGILFFSYTTPIPNRSCT